MSHRFALAYNPTLLTLLWFGTPLHAIAFHRARPGHALGVPRACVWHARVPELPRPAPHSLRSVTDRSQHAVSPSAPHEPRSSRHVFGRPTASRHRRPTAPALASAAQATSARQLALGTVAARLLAPAAIPSLAMMPASYRTSVADELIHCRREPTWERYIRKPLEPSEHASSLKITPPRFPVAASRPGEVFSPASGNHSHRRLPAPFGATRASPPPLSSPGTPSPSRESIPLLNLDRDSPRAKTHFSRRPPSAAELAVGSSIHPRDQNDHRCDRLDPLSPRVTSVSRTVPPFAGEHRRSPAPLTGRGRGGKVD